MNKEITKYGDMEIVKHKFCYFKYYIDKLKMSKKVSFSKKAFKTLLVTMMMETLGYYVYSFQS